MSFCGTFEVNKMKFHFVCDTPGTSFDESKSLVNNEIVKHPKHSWNINKKIYKVYILAIPDSIQLEDYRGVRTLRYLPPGMCLIEKDFKELCELPFILFESNYFDEINNETRAQIANLTLEGNDWNRLQDLAVRSRLSGITRDSDVLKIKKKEIYKEVEETLSDMYGELGAGLNDQITETVFDLMNSNVYRYLLSQGKEKGRKMGSSKYPISDLTIKRVDDDYNCFPYPKGYKFW